MPVFTIGNSESYDASLAEVARGVRVRFAKIGRAHGYPGGSVWRTADLARAYLQAGLNPELGFAVYEVDADWTTDTAAPLDSAASSSPYPWRDLLHDRPVTRRIDVFDHIFVGLDPSDLEHCAIAGCGAPEIHHVRPPEPAMAADVPPWTSDHAYQGDGELRCQATFVWNGEVAHCERPRPQHSGVPIADTLAARARDGIIRYEQQHGPGSASRTSWSPFINPPTPRPQLGHAFTAGSAERYGLDVCEYKIPPTDDSDFAYCGKPKADHEPVTPQQFKAWVESTWPPAYQPRPLPDPEARHALLNTSRMPCRCGCGAIFPYITNQHLPAAFYACASWPGATDFVPVPTGPVFEMPHLPECPHHPQLDQAPIVCPECAHPIHPKPCEVLQRTGVSAYSDPCGCTRTPDAPA